MIEASGLLPAIRARGGPAGPQVEGRAVRDAVVAVGAAGVVALTVALWVTLSVPTWPGAAGAVFVGVGASFGASFGVVVVALAGRSLVRRPGRRSGPADRVTLLRGVLSAGGATLAVPIAVGALPPRAWLLMALCVPALALDAVDGVVARRTGTASAAGRTLDGELDAALLLVLSVAATRSLGVWVLGIGLMRYAFFVAGALRPRLRGWLPFSQFRRVVAGLQGVALVVGLAPVVPEPVGRAVVAVALAMLTVSFGLDVLRLERSYEQPPRRLGWGQSTDISVSRCH